MVKKKKHDKDKYYQLARQQGYRARSAFKLIQLNKKYDFLSTARVCIDLCAAPGGWCQVAAKYMPASSIILGIDLLPIRPIKNVKTYVCDITTAECRQIIRKEVQTWHADVVLCDGAPNVGSEYSKDAFVQNELSLAALKLAVDVLGPHGTFVSKVFRSADYNALLWVFKQLFRKVSATKPLSSRNESAEIFVVCQDYLAPSSVDPKLLDPKYVFQQIDQGPNKIVNIFHPKYGEQKRFREGYDESLGQTLRRVKTVDEFVGTKDPVTLLSETNEIQFGEGDEIYLEHSATTSEIRLCLKDLKVLGKADFKGLLKWRLKMLKYRDTLKAASKEAETEKENATSQDKTSTDPAEEEVDPDTKVQQEIADLKAKQIHDKKKQKKKLRQALAKQRMRAALGINQESIELPEHDKIFSLAAAAASRSDIDGLAEVDLSKVDDPTEGMDDGQWSDGIGGFDSDSDDEDYNMLLEKQLDSLYDDYQQRSKQVEKLGSKAKKRTKVAKLAIAGEVAAQDAALYDGDKAAYHKLLTGKDKDDSDDSDSDMDERNPLIADPLSHIEPTGAVKDRWFGSNPLFKEIEEENKVLQSKTKAALNKESESKDEDAMDEDEEDNMPDMPKTDKEKRKEKRRQTLERKERKEAKKRKLMDEDFEVAAGTGDAELTGKPSGKDGEDEDSAELKRKKKLIAAGMGLALTEEQSASGKGADSFEIVSQSLPTKDTRQYDSDHEQYDAEDYARTLAIGTMMIQKSKAKELIDASYNRYTWNDEGDLPDWFMDDEEMHYKPQIPIPKEIMEKMKEKFIHLASKPIKKVAEARMRKKRKLLKKVKVAKKKAEEIANMSEMTTREKLKAMEKAMKNTRKDQRKKVYVVSRKNKSGLNVSGAKVKGAKVKRVDARMKSDLRALKRKGDKKGSKRSKVSRR